MTSALIRQANIVGGTAMVLAKGDATAGSILVITLEKGRITGIFERILGSSDSYVWMPISPQTIEDKEKIENFLSRKRQRDPDLWIIELDIPDTARFIAELDTMG